LRSVRPSHRHRLNRSLGTCVALAEHGSGVGTSRAQGGTAVLETIAIILLVLWLLGVVSGYTLGNFIYVLLVIAIILFLVRLVSGRRVV
jgi:uncharacterized membrane protein YjdF